MKTTKPLYLTDDYGETRPYTREELIARAEEGRRQIAMGNYTDIDVFMRELYEDFEKDMRKENFASVEELETVNV